MNRNLGARLNTEIRMISAMLQSPRHIEAVAGSYVGSYCAAWCAATL